MLFKEKRLQLCISLALLRVNVSRILDKQIKSAFEWKLAIILNFWFVVKRELRVSVASVFLF